MVESTHVAHWGTHITTKNVSLTSATLDMTVQIKGAAGQKVEVITKVYTKHGDMVKKFPRASLSLPSGTGIINTSITIDDPSLWGPPPTQKPNLYTARTQLFTHGYRHI